MNRRAAGRLARLLGAGALVLPLLACARPQAPSGALARTGSPHGPTTITCSRCHQPDGWRPLRTDSDFDHGRETAFALTGGHVRVACAACHLALRFDEPHAAAGSCAVCHVDVHAGALGAECRACHDTRSFAASGRRDPHAGTGFPLTGRHRQIECEACHADARADFFAPIPADCASCHAAAYARAVPDHAAAGFTTACAGCHGTFGWAGARFDHARNTGYPLEGAHARSECQACHMPPAFALRRTPLGPRDCVACHRDDYDRAHPNLGFTGDCLSCHTLDSFRGARWAEHDARFPIYTGKHAGRWTSCAQCHAGTGFGSVSCLECHEHSRARMDDKHRGRSGYSYTTVACLGCHPRGRKE